MRLEVELKEEIKELEQQLEKAALSLLDETDTKSFFEVRRKLDLKKQKLRDGVDRRDFELVVKINLIPNKNYSHVR